MVRVSNYHLRESKDGRQFVALELEGDMEMVQSMETGRFYATARRCSVTSTFSEQAAKALIGTQMPGRVERQDCDPYDYVVPETGEVISLGYRWEYVPEKRAVEPIRFPVAEVVS